jgi:Nitrile hydratase, alpha chain
MASAPRPSPLRRAAPPLGSATTIAHPGLSIVLFPSDRPGRHLPPRPISTTHSHSWWTEKRGPVTLAASAHQHHARSWRNRYKSLPYRSLAVSDPRRVLAEFWLELGDDVELRVVDSTADIRYLMIPRRPPGTDELSEERLAALVTRDSTIGFAQPAAPAHA